MRNLDWISMVAIAGCALLLCVGCGGAVVAPPGGSVGGAPAPDFVPLPGDPVGGGGGGGGNDGSLAGGVVATLIQGDEQFTVWVTDPEAAQRLFDIANHGALFTVISGPIRTGSGQSQFNAPWSWHLDPAAVRVGQPTSNDVRYSGTPSDVENNLEDLVAQGRHKVTGSGDARLFMVVDYRDGVPMPGEIPIPRSVR